MNIDQPSDAENALYHLVFTPDDRPHDTVVAASGDLAAMRTAWLDLAGHGLHENHHMDACAKPPSWKTYAEGVRYALHLDLQRPEGRRIGTMRVRIADHTYTVTSVLGETRQAVAAPDGSYNCPFCGYAVPAEAVHDALPGTRVCGNPVCDAGRLASIASAIDRQTEREAAARRDEERRRRAQVMTDYLAQRRQAEHDERERRLVEARQGGYCPVCILGRDGRKIRHRRPENCPRPREVIVAPTRTT